MFSSFQAFSAALGDAHILVTSVIGDLHFTFWAGLRDFLQIDVHYLVDVNCVSLACYLALLDQLGQFAMSGLM